jgi:DUF4097 and DUF4098 domain-containing protein YvlB
MKNRVFIAAAVFAVSGLAYAQPMTKTFRADGRFTIAPGGTLILENAVGNVEIVGSDGTEVEATTLTTVTGLGAAAIDEGHRRTITLVGGDARTRVLRTSATTDHKDWDVSVDWSVKVPRTTNVSVLSQVSRRIGVMNIAGNVHVKNFAGTVVVHNSTGETLVESVNGSIAYSTPQLGSNAVLTSVNGHITASLPGDADIQWVAETAKGEIRTNLPARGDFEGNVYRGTINGPGGSTITTATLMGNIYLLALGSGMSGAHVLKRPQTPGAPSATNAATTGIKQDEPYKGFFHFYTTLGDVILPQIEGEADIFTGAGRVELGKVTGTCKVFSNGGPLQFGDIFGQLDASTQGGDITVDRARRGGFVKTQGGTIRVLYMNGPMQLISGGGDVTVRRTTAPVKAQTSSGDISIAVDKGSATETIDAKTEKGNVIIHVGVNFAADVDATIVTSDPDSDTIVSDLPGLSIRREQIGGGKTRVRATGKIHGGGERLQLEASGGDIRITTAPLAPAPPRRK